MFVFVFEGALFALTYNGDRFVLFTLLPRRKPRTERCSCLFVLLLVAVVRRHTGLNLTSSRLLRFACPAGGWPGFLLHRGRGRPSAVLVKGAGGLSARVFVFGGRGFSFSAGAAVAARFPSSFALASAAGRGLLGRAVYVFVVATLLCLRLRFSRRCAHRCRTRCSRSCSRAHCPR